MNRNLILFIIFAHLAMTGYSQESIQQDYPNFSLGISEQASAFLANHRYVNKLPTIGAGIETAVDFILRLNHHVGIGAEAACYLRIADIYRSMEAVLLHFKLVLPFQLGCFLIQPSIGICSSETGLVEVGARIGFGRRNHFIFEINNVFPTNYYYFPVMQIGFGFRWEITP